MIVLDQFPRGLFADTPQACSSDPDTLRIVEEGFRNDHYDAPTSLWERFFYFLPLAHVEGPDHLERMRRIVAISERVEAEAPAPLQPIWEFSLSQAQANLDVITRFGRFPHRNPILGRVSAPEEAAYLEKGEFGSQAGAACSIPIDGQFTRIGQARRDVPGSQERRLSRAGRLEPAQPRRERP